MDARFVFNVWAPAASDWSRWAKTAPFAQIARATSEISRLPPEQMIPPNLPLASAGCALVIHLPGAAAIGLGLAAARVGYRPVPLFNACSPQLADRSPSQPIAVDTDSILAGLAEAAPQLSAINLPSNAAPAFLIDALRTTPRCVIGPEVFDNRSVVFASDFPSAGLLRSRGIQRTLLIQDHSLSIGRDLLTALAPWRRDGLPVDAIGMDGAALQIDWPAIGFASEWRERLFAALRLRRNMTGGFGGFVPESSGG